MIKLVLLDADGVVVHGEQFSVRYSKKFGVPIEEITVFFNNEFQNCLVGKADLRDVLLPYLKKWGWMGTVDELLKFWFGEYIIDTEVIKILKAVKGDRVYVLATNQEKYRVDYLMNKMGLDKVFNLAIGSHRAGHLKNDPDYYKYVFNLFPEIKPQEILFLDDREKNIIMAKSLGINAVLYNNLDDLKIIK